MAEQVLEKIIALVRARPTITVRELARELGFSEERSVYYWLRKAGHKGLKSLKEQVVWAGPPAAVREEERRIGGDAAGPGAKRCGSALRSGALSPWWSPPAHTSRGSKPATNSTSTRRHRRRRRPGPRRPARGKARRCAGHIRGRPRCGWSIPPTPGRSVNWSPAPGQIRGVVLRLVRGRP